MLYYNIFYRTTIKYIKTRWTKYLMPYEYSIRHTNECVKNRNYIIRRSYVGCKYNVNKLLKLYNFEQFT